MGAIEGQVSQKNNNNGGSLLLDGTYSMTEAAVASIASYVPFEPDMFDAQVEASVGDDGSLIVNETREDVPELSMDGVRSNDLSFLDTALPVEESDTSNREMETPDKIVDPDLYREAAVAATVIPASEMIWPPGDHVPVLSQSDTGKSIPSITENVEPVTNVQQAINENSCAQTVTSQTVMVGKAVAADESSSSSGSSSSSSGSSGSSSSSSSSEDGNADEGGAKTKRLRKTKKKDTAAASASSCCSSASDTEPEENEPPKTKELVKKHATVNSVERKRVHTSTPVPKRTKAKRTKFVAPSTVECTAVPSGSQQSLHSNFTTESVNGGELYEFDVASPNVEANCDLHRSVSRRGARQPLMSISSVVHMNLDDVRAQPNSRDPPKQWLSSTEKRLRKLPRRVVKRKPVKLLKTRRALSFPVVAYTMERNGKTVVSNELCDLAYPADLRLVSLRYIADKHLDREPTIASEKVGVQLREMSTFFLKECRHVSKLTNCTQIDEGVYDLVYGAVPQRMENAAAAFMKFCMNQYNQFLRDLCGDSPDDTDSIESAYAVFPEGEIEMMCYVYWHLYTQDLIDWDDNRKRPTVKRYLAEAWLSLPKSNVRNVIRTLANFAEPDYVSAACMMYVKYMFSTLISTGKQELWDNVLTVSGLHHYSHGNTLYEVHQRLSTAKASYMSRCEQITAQNREYVTTIMSSNDVFRLFDQQNWFRYDTQISNELRISVNSILYWAVRKLACYIVKVGAHKFGTNIVSETVAGFVQDHRYLFGFNERSVLSPFPRTVLARIKRKLYDCVRSLTDSVAKSTVLRLQPAAFELFVAFLKRMLETALYPFVMDTSKSKELSDIGLAFSLYYEDTVCRSSFVGFDADAWPLCGSGRMVASRKKDASDEKEMRYNEPEWSPDVNMESDEDDEDEDYDVDCDIDDFELENIGSDIEDYDESLFTLKDTNKSTESAAVMPVVVSRRFPLAPRKTMLRFAGDDDDDIEEEEEEEEEQDEGVAEKDGGNADEHEAAVVDKTSEERADEPIVPSPDMRNIVATVRASGPSPTESSNSGKEKQVSRKRPKENRIKSNEKVLKQAKLQLVPVSISSSSTVSDGGWKEAHPEKIKAHDLFRLLDEQKDLRYPPLANIKVSRIRCCLCTDITTVRTMRLNDSTAVPACAYCVALLNNDNDVDLAVLLDRIDNLYVAPLAYEVDKENRRRFLSVSSPPSSYPSTTTICDDEANVLFLCFFHRMMLSPIVLYARLATTFSLVKPLLVRKPSEGGALSLVVCLRLYRYRYTAVSMATIICYHSHNIYFI